MEAELEQEEEAAQALASNLCEIDLEVSKQLSMVQEMPMHEMPMIPRPKEEVQRGRLASRSCPSANSSDRAEA